MRLTLPAAEPGFRYILADGVRVGVAFTVWSNTGPHHEAWEAHLYACLTYPDIDQDVVRRLRLGALRHDLRMRLDEHGPWWTA